MTKKEDGGPAFPAEDAFQFYSGMSLRDHFAGLAMSAIPGKAYVQLSAAAKEAGMRERDFLVKAAYEAADAMLAERAK